MQHRKKGRKLSRKKANRNHLLRNLAAQVILYEEIKTTMAKAKEVRPLIEKAINIAKKKDKILALRKLNKIFFDKNAVKKIINDLSGQFKNKKSGYTSLVKLYPRPGDGAAMVNLRLTLSERRRRKKLKTKIEVRERKEKKKAKKEGIWDRIKEKGTSLKITPKAKVRTKTRERTTSK